MAKSKDILDVFPIWKVERDCLVSTRGEYTACYEVTLPEIFSLSAKVEMVDGGRLETGDFREMNDIWVKALNVLPVNTIIHKQDLFLVEQYTPRYELRDAFDKASERHFNERPYLSHRCYVYVTKTYGGRHSVAADLTTLVSARIVPKEMGDPRKQEEFFNALGQFESVLTSTKKIGLRRIKGNELVFDEHTGELGLVGRYMSLAFTDDVVPLADIQMDGDIHVGNKICKFFSIADVDDMPDVVYTHNRKESLCSEKSTINVSFAAPVALMLNVDHAYNQYVFKTDKHISFPELEKRSQKMKALGSFSKINAVNARQIDMFLDDAASSGFTPVQCHYNLMVWTEDKGLLPQIRNQVNSAISLMGARPRENGTDAPLLFWAGIPGAAADLPSEDRFWTFLPQACSMFNMESTTSDDLSTFGVKVTERLSGRPLLVDFSDVPVKKGWCSNRNKFILGPSGSGKSFLTNHFLRQYHHSGAHTVIVDVGDSYEGLCTMLGGLYLTYKEEAPIRFNPFYIDERKLPSIEKKQAIQALLFALWKKEDETFTRSDQTAVAGAIAGYFDKLNREYSIVPNFNSFYEFLKTDFRDLLHEKEVDVRLFDFDGFLFNLEPFYKGGQYDFLLNADRDLDLLREPFIVFEMDNIKDHPILFPVVTIIIMDTFITKMRQLPKKVRKLILIEEAWKAIMKPEMAEFMQYLYKTVRKFFGEAWIVTQQLQDIIDSPIVKDSIIGNADCKILLDQRRYQNQFTKAREFLGLTEKEASMALSLNRDNDPAYRYKEFFVSFGGQHSAVYRLEVSRMEYWAFTTEAPEKEQIKQKTAQNGGNVVLAIRQQLEEEATA